MKPEWYKVLGRGMHPILMIDTVIRGLNERLDDILGFDFNFQYYLRYNGATFFEKNEWERLKDIFREKDLDFYFKIIEKRVQLDKETVEFSQRIANMDVSRLSLIELKKLFVEFMDKEMPRVGSVYIPFNLEEIFEDIIKNELGGKVAADKVDEYFALLTTCPKETYSNREKRKLLELAVDRINFKENPLIMDKIKKHSSDFIWLNQYFFLVDLYTPEKVIDRLNKIEDPVKELEKLKLKSIKTEEKFNQLVKELDLSPRIVKIARAAQEHSHGRDNLVGSAAKIYYNCLDFFNELAKRVGMSYETFIELRINDVIFFLDKLIEIKKIKQGYGIYLDNGRIDIYTGKDIEKIKVDEGDVKGITSVEGQIANRGYAKGRVKIFMGAYDKKDMQAGDILVSPMTTPNLSLFMEKAGAIVTEEGGLTCHAAIIAREMGKPCIIGTKIACSVFKDNDLVEVDAEKGVIRKLESE